MPNVKNRSPLVQILSMFDPRSLKGGALLSMLLFALIGGSYYIYKSFAFTPQLGVVSLYTNPATGPKKGSFSVPIYVHGTGVPLNAVDIKVWYPSNKLQYLGLDDTSTKFSLKAQNTNTIYGTYGYLNIAKGTISSCSGACLITKINFKVLPGASGEAAINFGVDSKAITSNSNTDVLKMTQSGIYTVSP